MVFRHEISSHLMTDENYNTQITLKVDKAISYKS